MVLHNDPNWMRAGHWFKSGSEGDFAILGVGASKSAITPNKSFLTPSAVREALLKYSTYFADANLDLAEKLAAVDLGDIEKPDLQSVCIEDISKFNNKTLVLLGGDNSITYSGVSALAKKVGFEKIGLITLDAHHDLRDGISMARQSNNFWMRDCQVSKLCRLESMILQTLNFMQSELKLLASK